MRDGERGNIISIFC